MRRNRVQKCERYVSMTIVISGFDSNREFEHSAVLGAGVGASRPADGESGGEGNRRDQALGQYRTQVTHTLTMGTVSSAQRSSRVPKGSL